MTQDGTTINRRGALVLCLLCLAFFVDVLASTSVFTAGPAIQRDLGLSSVQLQWTFTAATLPAGALLLAGGRLADYWGRRPMFMSGMALFVGSSLICGVAGSGEVLIVARGLQGAAGAVLIPAALSLVMNLFESGRPRTIALAAWSGIGGVGATAGLLLGGLVTQGFGWRWVFLVNVPVGIVTLGLTPFLISRSARRRWSGRFDLPGTLSITLGLAALVYGISGVPERGWLHPQTVLSLSAGAAWLTAFGWIEVRSSDPLIPPRLLRSRALVGGNLVLLATGVSVDGLLFTLTLFTQRVLGYSAIEFALVTSVMSSVGVLSSYLAQRAVGRVGIKVIARTGLLLLSLSCLTFAACARWGDGSIAALGAGMVLFGMGMGSAFLAGSIACLAGVAEEDSGVAAGVQNVSFSIGTTVGVATLSTVAAATATRLIATGATAAAGESGGQQAAFVVAAGVGLLGCTFTRLIPGHRPQRHTPTGQVAAVVTPAYDPGSATTYPQREKGSS